MIKGNLKCSVTGFKAVCKKKKKKTGDHQGHNLIFHEWSKKIIINKYPRARLNIGNFRV